MARAGKLEAALGVLAALRSNPRGLEAMARLREALATGPSHAAALAAQIVSEAEIEELEDALGPAFERFLVHAERRDPGCHAKQAIAEALHQLRSDAGALFLRGAAHVQMEPVWGGREDTAAALRGACARGLFRIHHPEALRVVAELLADPERPARIAAARVLAHQAALAAVPVLRLKLRSGDTDPEVTCECLIALFACEGETALPFAAALLEGDDAERAEAAALALGASRLPGALPVLRSFYESCVDPELSRHALTAIATLRFDDGFDYLFGMIERAPGPLARDALTALGLYRDDAALAARVRAAVAAREDADLSRALRDAFGEG